jgi:phosphonate transport system substrate-binding protein
MHIIRKIVTAAVLSFSILFGATAGEKVYNLAITDLEGLEQVQREFGSFKELLEEKTGMKFKFFAVSNRTAAVEAMKSEKVDFALTGPAEYVVFKKRVDCKQVVGFSRPDYFATIIVKADSGITSVKDLKKKKVAIGSVGSTSKHLAPLQILKDNGLNPMKDVDTVHTSVKLGWEALKKGNVEAFGTTNSKFVSLRMNETEYEPGAFKVIARGPDLPNDLLLAGSHVSDKTVKRSQRFLKSIPMNWSPK